MLPIQGYLLEILKAPTDESTEESLKNSEAELFGVTNLVKYVTGC